MATTILQGKVEGSRIRGRPLKDWMSNITIWPSFIEEDI